MIGQLGRPIRSRVCLHECRKRPLYTCLWSDYGHTKTFWLLILRLVVLIDVVFKVDFAAIGLLHAWEKQNVLYSPVHRYSLYAKTWADSTTWYILRLRHRVCRVNKPPSETSAARRSSNQTVVIRPSHLTGQQIRDIINSVAPFQNI